MAAIGDGWETDAWIEGGWVTGAWLVGVVAPILQFLRPLRGLEVGKAGAVVASRLHFRLEVAGESIIPMLRRRRRR